MKIVIQHVFLYYCIDSLLIQHLMANLNMTIGKETWSWHFFPKVVIAWKSPANVSSRNMWYLLDYLFKPETK